MNLRTFKSKIFKSTNSQRSLIVTLLIGACYTLFTWPVFLDPEISVFWAQSVFFFSLFAPVIYVLLRERFSVFLKNKDSKNTILLKTIPYFFSLMAISWTPLVVSIVLAESANSLETSIILFLCILFTFILSVDRCTDLLFWRNLDKHFGKMKIIA